MMSDLVAWWDDAADGPCNMAADEVLAAEAVRQNRPLMRFYGWSDMTFSLGAFQPIAGAESEPAIATLPVVRRPSGGGGIVHGSDLTYAVAVPRSHAWGSTPQVLYDAFHESLVTVLRSRGFPAALHPGRAHGASDESLLFCFDRRARGDVIVHGDSADGDKLLGSAQRRLSGAVLQHGSLLLRAPPRVGSAAAHPGLRDLFPAAHDWTERDLVAAWLGQIEASSGLRPSIEKTGFAPAHAAAIAEGSIRFRDAAWVRRR